MPRTRKAKSTDVPETILDQFAGPARAMSQSEVDAITKRFKKALVERMLGGELTHHLGYPPGGEKRPDTTNQRNGTSGNTVLTDDGPLTPDIPRDREGTLEPQLIGTHERRFTGFDDKILALYARGLTVREIQAFLVEMYAVEVSPDFISSVTDAVHAEVTAWQSRPLDAMYPVVFFDALRVKIRDEATVRSKAVYLALAVLPDGSRDILGIWIAQTEGAKFWMKVFADLKTRGCQDILIAVTDGLIGIEEALAAVFPHTTLQTCIVHLLRQSLDFASRKQRKPLAAALRAIYTAPSADLAQEALDAFERGEWGQRFPTIVAALRRAWSRVIPFFAFPPEIRRVLYTTNALESVHAQLRKIIKTRGHFPHDDAATKLIWLALRNITSSWARAAPTWRQAMNQFAILYGDRFTPVAPRCRNQTGLTHKIPDTPARRAPAPRQAARTGTTPASRTLFAGVCHCSSPASITHFPGKRSRLSPACVPALPRQASRLSPASVPRLSPACIAAFPRQGSPALPRQVSRLSRLRGRGNYGPRACSTTTPAIEQPAGPQRAKGDTHDRAGRMRSYRRG